MSDFNSLLSLSKVFNDSNDIIKFTTLQQICFIITSFDSNIINSLFNNKQTKEYNEFIHNIRQGLFDILSNRIDKEFLYDALYLSHFMLQYNHCGGKWAIEIEKFPPLLLQICRTEIIMYLGGYEQSKNDINNKIIILKQEDKHLIIACYNLIEDCIFNLVSEEDNKQPSWTLLPNNIIQNIQQVLFDIFKVIIKYLKEYFNNSLFIDINNDNNNNDNNDICFIKASIKIFLIWSSEDPYTYEKEFKELLPNIISLCSNISDINISIHELLITCIYSLDKVLDNNIIELLYPIFIQYIINWKKNHSDITDIYNDITAYRCICLLNNFKKQNIKHINDITEIEDLIDLGN